MSTVTMGNESNMKIPTAHRQILAAEGGRMTFTQGRKTMKDRRRSYKVCVLQHATQNGWAKVILFSMSSRMDILGYFQATLIPEE